MTEPQKTTFQALNANQLLKDPLDPADGWGIPCQTSTPRQGPEVETTGGLGQPSTTWNATCMNHHTGKVREFPPPQDSRGMPQAPNEDKEMFRRFTRVMCEAQRQDPPAKDSHKAPKTWDGQPDQLPQFLQQLEELFDNYRIKGRECVSTMLEYVDDLAKGMIWELRGFRDCDFDQLKEELKDLMGQPWEHARYHVTDLEAMTEEAARHSFKSEREFHSAYMRFLQISGWLTNAGKL
ncbi:hypothetical protein OPQ81_011062 [Rhizoctonia solani]|nr:hypothetical protein OPQ81_011062 [Rhizoctonia solani]